MNKIKQVREHENVDVRLMIRFLDRAMTAARAGKIDEVCTNVRLARDYEDSIPRNIRIDGLGNI